MTYCLGIFSKEGVAAIADTLITSGRDTTTARKIITIQRDNHAYFIMTSGLRSVRDKAITYFNEVVEHEDKNFDKLYKAVNKFGEQVKRVAKEDKEMLTESGMDFNLHAIVGGQCEKDGTAKLFMLYPQGNWIEIGRGTPFAIIGNSGFGSPILKRSLSYDSSLMFGLKSGFLSFDATRIASNDVGYPIDVVLLKNDSFKPVEKRFEENDLRSISEYWDGRLRNSIEELPADKLTLELNYEENRKVDNHVA